MSTAVEASAPASSANLGPGFDCIALALDIRCRVSATRSDGWSIEHLGPQRPPPGADDAVLEAARRAVGNDLPLALQVDNSIPIARGLGSSSAAAAAGALAAWRATGKEPHPRQVFDVVAGMEGHPDNAAATVFGGLVLATATSVHRLPWSGLLRPVLAIPDAPFPTREARAALPQAYPTEEVVRSIGRTAALVAGLLSGDATVLADAAGDEIHEQVRSRIRPDVAGLIQVARRAGAAHAAWSGAGPSVVALVHESAADSVIGALRRQLGDSGTVATPPVAVRGAV